MPFITSVNLDARRLEAAEAALARAAVSDAVAIAGGWALFAGVGTPFSHAIGLGLDGRVSDDEIDQLEAFYRTRGSPVVVELCPLADPSLVDLLGQRGYRLTQFENTLATAILAGLLPSAPATHAEIRSAAPEESEIWARTVLSGFSEGMDLTPDQVEMGASFFRMPGQVSLLACIGGHPAGGAALGIHDGVGFLYGDAVLPGFRRRGIHGALIHARLLRAAESGCDVAMASTLPGSGSERNYQRLGFRVCYTRATLMRDWDFNGGV